MYNEDEFLFARTLIGVFKNIEYMCSRTNSKTWGKDAWKKIVVCVISDGRAKINPRTRAVLAALGVYQDGIAKQQVNGKDVTAHIYEYTTQLALGLKGTQVSIKGRSATPVQMIFCLKEKNQKKINSHRWFFQAFGRVLDPNICVLLDAGTNPAGTPSTIFGELSTWNQCVVELVARSKSCWTREKISSIRWLQHKTLNTR